MVKINENDKSLISELNANLVTNRGNKAFLSISMHLQDGVDVGTVEKEFLKIVHDCKDKYLTNELLQEQKEKTSCHFKFLLETPEALFMDIIDAVASELKIADEQ